VALEGESENLSDSSSLSVSTAIVAVCTAESVAVVQPAGRGGARGSSAGWLRLPEHVNPPAGAPSAGASTSGAIRYSPRREAARASKTPSGVTLSPPRAPVPGSSEISTRQDPSPTAVPQRKTSGERGTSFSPSVPIETIRASGA
jgi:hypothetical protein